MSITKTMIDSRDIKELHPILQVLTNEFLRIAKERNLPVAVTSTYRNHEMQDYYYNVTKTTTVKGGYSYHNHRLAVDIVPLINGVPAWPQPAQYNWNRLGETGESLGLEWGGRWTSFVDRPHYQMTFGLTCAEILNGKAIPQKIVRGCPDRRLVRLVQELVGVTVDGIFGDLTLAAVKRFIPSGEVDAAGLKLLLDRRNAASQPTPVPVNEFSDVPTGHWSASAFREMQKRGIITGYDENGKRVAGFGKPMETERIVQLLWNLMQYLEGKK